MPTIGNRLRLCGALALAACWGGAAQAWEPTKPVEIVVAAGAGGASDQMARMLQVAVQKNGLDEAADGGLAQRRGVRRRGADVHEGRAGRPE